MSISTVEINEGELNEEQGLNTNKIGVEVTTVFQNVGRMSTHRINAVRNRSSETIATKPPFIPGVSSDANPGVTETGSGQLRK